MNYKVFYGGWYQRTTLHLTEIYDFLHKCDSKLDLNKDRLTEYFNLVAVSNIERKVDYLEYISGNSGDINIKYYEDGLYLLQLESDNVLDAKERLEKYFNQRLNPAITYIFSLGAPTPKILANIKPIHPLVVIVETKDHLKYEVNKLMFGEVYSKIISDKFSVFKTPNFILIATAKNNVKKLEGMVEMQIFFREFKDQMERYLNIHRKVWEEITQIKEMGNIRGRLITKYKAKLDSYDRTVNLINNRINQMGTYVKTRQSISKELGVEDHLLKVFDYKFETLMNTLTYIKEIWNMTKDYLKNVVSILTDIENQSLNNSIKSLQIITSIGVVSGILGYVTKSELPRITKAGLEYLFVLIFFTLLVNYTIFVYYRNIKYKIKISDTSNSL